MTERELKAEIQRIVYLKYERTEKEKTCRMERSMRDEARKDYQKKLEKMNIEELTKEGKRIKEKKEIELRNEKKEY